MTLKTKRNWYWLGFALSSMVLVDVSHAGVGCDQTAVEAIAKLNEAGITKIATESGYTEGYDGGKLEKILDQCLTPENFEHQAAMIRQAQAERRSAILQLALIASLNEEAAKRFAEEIRRAVSCEKTVAAVTKHLWTTNDHGYRDKFQYAYNSGYADGFSYEPDCSRPDEIVRHWIRQ